MDKMIGQSCLDLIVPEDHELCIETVQKCLLEPDKSFRVILRKPLRSGIEFSQWDFKALKDGQNNICEILCIGHEITSLITKQDQLQSLVDINLEQNKRLMQFTHIVSHNIRSHVANLKGIVLQFEKHPHQDTLTYLELIKRTTASLDDTIMNLNETITVQSNLEMLKKEIHCTIL
jgi:light-regulated signal transduction histidine kinase (bacteriophytochrome)